MITEKLVLTSSALPLASLAIAFELSTCSSAIAAGCAPPRLENTVQLEPVGDQGEVTVPVTLNGVEKNLLFDTGGGLLNYISGAVVKELNLDYMPSERSATPAPTTESNGNRFLSFTFAADVTFGAVKASHVPFVIWPALPYDGILSAGTLTSDDLDIDFGAMKLNFFSADHCEGAVVYWPHQALAVVPVRSALGHIELTVMLDGHPLSAVIDTGTPWTSVDIKSAEDKLGFSPGVRAPQGPDDPKDDPGKEIYFRKYSALSFPGVTIANPLVVVHPNRLGPDMIIGMEVLRHLHLYYAVKEQKLYVTPAVSGQSPLPKNAAPSPSDHTWPQNAHQPTLWDLAVGAGGHVHVSNNLDPFSLNW
jgi:hypothetical protein